MEQFMTAALALPAAVLPVSALPTSAVPMPPPLTGSAVADSWDFNLITIGVLLLVGVVYVAGVVRLRRRGEHWAISRTVTFCLLGLGGFGYTTMSFLGVYQQVLFWPRAVQIITLLMVVPMFLALGSPVRLAVEAGPQWLSRTITSALDSGAARFLTFPAVVSGIFLTTPFLVYFTPVYETTVRSRGAGWLLSVALVGVGFLYYWTRLRIDPVPKEYPHLLSVWITFAEAIADGALGLTLMLGNSLVAGDYYRAIGRPWGLSLKQDQVLGGGLLWLIGDMAGVPFLGALWRRMFHEDQQKAAEIDEVLDALDAAAAASAASSAAESSGSVDADGWSPEEAERSRPWWESDPVLGVRYGFRQPE